MDDKIRSHRPPLVTITLYERLVSSEPILTSSTTTNLGWLNYSRHAKFQRISRHTGFSFSGCDIAHLVKNNHSRRFGVGRSAAQFVDDVVSRQVSPPDPPVVEELQTYKLLQTARSGPNVAIPVARRAIQIGEIRGMDSGAQTPGPSALRATRRPILSSLATRRTVPQLSLPRKRALARSPPPPPPRASRRAIPTSTTTLPSLRLFRSAFRSPYSSPSESKGAAASPRRPRDGDPCADDLHGGSPARARLVRLILPYPDKDKGATYRPQVRTLLPFLHKLNAAAPPTAAAPRSYVAAAAAVGTPTAADAAAVSSL
eukprot:1192916-Prorocentrum_minimum.AAC.1